MSNLKHVSGKISLEDWGFVHDYDELGPPMAKIFAEALSDTLEGGSDSPTIFLSHAFESGSADVLMLDVELPLEKQGYILECSFIDIIDDFLETTEMLDRQERRADVSAALRKLADKIDSAP